MESEDDDKDKKALKELYEEMQAYQEWVESQLAGVCRAGYHYGYVRRIPLAGGRFVIRGYYSSHDGSKDEAFHEAYF